MNLHMFLEVTGLIEAFGAYITVKQFLSSMGSHMSLQVVGLGKERSARKGLLVKLGVVQKKYSGEVVKY